MLCENRLEIHIVISGCLRLDPFRYRKVAEASSGSGIVNDFGYKAVVISELQFVADTDFSGRFYDYIPEPLLSVQFAEEEYFDISIIFLLFSEKPGRKYLGIIQDEGVAFSEIISNVFENLVLYLACVLVKNHHAALISPFAGRFMGNVILQ